MISIEPTVFKEWLVLGGLRNPAENVTTPRAFLATRSLAIRSGSVLGGMLAATSPGFRAVILSGAGASWIEFPSGARNPNLGVLAKILLSLPATETLDRFHPALALFDLGVASANNVHFVDDILVPTRPGRGPPQVRSTRMHTFLSGHNSIVPLDMMNHET